MNQNPQIAPAHICPTTYYRLGVPNDDKETETVTASVRMEDDELEEITLIFWHFNRPNPILNIDYGFIRCIFQGQTYQSAVDDLDVVTQELYLQWAGGDKLLLIHSSFFDFFTGK